MSSLTSLNTGLPSFVPGDACLFGHRAAARRSPTIPTPAHVARPGHGCSRAYTRSIRWSVRDVATR